MKEEVDGGTFTAKNEEVKPEVENKFISGEPSMITTDEVFALLGEQMIRAKNWSKIALAWNRNFNALKDKVAGTEFQFASLTKQNQELKDSNSKYIIANQSLDKRITDLNTQIREVNTKITLGDKTYMELNIKYRESENLTQLLKTQIDNLTKENLNLKEIKEMDEKEKIQLKEKMLSQKKKTKVANKQYGSVM